MKIQIKETELIKVLTIKKKYLEGLRGKPILKPNEKNYDSFNFIGYIADWESILVERKDNAHIGLLPDTTYIMYCEQNAGEVLGGDDYRDNWREASAYARSQIQNLPQLFLD